MHHAVSATSGRTRGTLQVLRESRQFRPGPNLRGAVLRLGGAVGHAGRQPGASLAARGASDDGEAHRTSPRGAHRRIVTPASARLTAGLRAARRAPWYRPAVALYHWSYRRLHRLDQPAAPIEPVPSVQRCGRWRALQLADGTRLGRGAAFGALHLDNVRARALHGAGRDPVTIGIEFRRLFLTSLRALAARATDSGPLARFEAYSVTTLFHHRLPILGFAPAPADRPICRHVMSW